MTGAFVTSDSWGTSGTTAYDNLAQAVDLSGWVMPLWVGAIAAGNDGE